jgi:hypothetical protein
MIRRYIPHIKTLIIVLLALCATLLTTRLWFHDLSGSSVRNAMLALLSLAQPETNSGQNFFVKPARIITAFGNNRFEIMYNNIDASMRKRDSDEAILLALDSGEHRSYPADIEALLAVPGYAFNYSVPMPSAAFVISYPQRRSALTSRVRSFEWIIIRPYPNAGVGVIFLDTDGRAHEYHIDDVYLEKRISQNITALAAESHRLVYSFERGFFIPRTEGFVYPAVVMENQYMDQGGLLLDYVRRRIDVFFGDAGSQWERATVQSLTFSDENTVVKYFPADTQNGLDVLEYANYRVIDQRILTSLASDYNSAMRFISRDPTIENEFYLIAVEERGHRRVFYFNYAINDLPVAMSPQDTGRTGLIYPIEIEIEYGVVVRYRKLVYSFVNAGERTADVSYEDVLSSLLVADERPEDLPLDDISLMYRIDVGRDMVLYWLIELDGRIFSQSAQADLDF